MISSALMGIYPAAFVGNPYPAKYFGTSGLAAAHTGNAHLYAVLIVPSTNPHHLSLPSFLAYCLGA